jgi:mannose-6-phosphate isomerase-like protein (cupin superfamily)
MKDKNAEALMQYIFRKKDAISVDLKNPTRTAYLYVDKHTGAKNISGGSADIPVNSELPYHAHENEEEIMFIYRGKGVLVVEGETFPLEPETMVFVPPGLKHTFKNTGTEPLIFLCSGGP